MGIRINLKDLYKLLSLSAFEIRDCDTNDPDAEECGKVDDIDPIQDDVPRPSNAIKKEGKDLF